MKIKEFVALAPGTSLCLNDEVMSPAAHIGVPNGTRVDFKYVLDQSDEEKGLVIVQVQGLPLLLSLSPRFLERV